MSKPKQVAVQIYLPEKTAREAKAICALGGISMKDWLGSMVDSAIANHRKERNDG